MTHQRDDIVRMKNVALRIAQTTIDAQVRNEALEELRLLHELEFSLCRDDERLTLRWMLAELQRALRAVVRAPVVH